MKKVLGVIIKKIYKFLMIIIYRPKIIGKENIPKDTAAIICPNHVHALDSTLIISMNKRHIKTLAKEELFKNRLAQSSGTLEKPVVLRQLRKEIARLKTVLTEREMDGEK